MARWMILVLALVAWMLWLARPVLVGWPVCCTRDAWFEPNCDDGCGSRLPAWTKVTCTAAWFEAMVRLAHETARACD